MQNKCLVTGANGHLGFNLVRFLVENKKPVQAGIRNMKYKHLFSNIDCEVVEIDLHDKKKLVAAMSGVHILYQVAAVFQHWARNPQLEIIESNLKATKNVIEAANEVGVSKIVFVSSIAAVDHNCHPLSESTWNTDFSNPYYRSKIESEQLAWDLAEKFKLWMVSVLPSVIIGPNCNNQYTPSMEILHSVLNNKFPFDPQFHFNFIDVRDVVKGMLLALEKGKHGERYLIANHEQTTSTQLFELAQKHYQKTKKPLKLPKLLLYLIATFGKTISCFTQKAPPLLRNWIKLYYRTDFRCDISKSEKELGFDPASPERALIQAFEYIKNEMTKRGTIEHNKRTIR